MDSNEYKQYLANLAQKWRMEFITEPEYLELDNWYCSLEDSSLVNIMRRLLNVLIASVV